MRVIGVHVREAVIQISLDFLKKTQQVWHEWASSVNGIRFQKQLFGFNPIQQSEDNENVSLLWVFLHRTALFVLTATPDAVLQSVPHDASLPAPEYSRDLCETKRNSIHRIFSICSKYSFSLISNIKLRPWISAACTISWNYTWTL